jgi:formiminotetrahydrofolate cyclodeaminase
VSAPLDRDPTEALSALAAGLAASAPPTGAGIVAAGVTGMAAGLSESIARASLGSWARASGAAVQAITLRRRAEIAGREDAEAYGSARAALALSASPSSATGRDAALRAALIAAADALLAIAAISADCAALAAEIAAHCAPEVRADAAGAAELAAAAARVADGLVQINLALTSGDPRRVRARELAQAAAAEVRRARDAG